MLPGQHWTISIGPLLEYKIPKLKKFQNIKNENGIFAFSKIKTIQLQQPIMVHGIGPILVSNWKKSRIYQKLANFM